MDDKFPLKKYTSKPIQHWMLWYCIVIFSESTFSTQTVNFQHCFSHWEEGVVLFDMHYFLLKNCLLWKQENMVPSTWTMHCEWYGLSVGYCHGHSMLIYPLYVPCVCSSIQYKVCTMPHHSPECTSFLCNHFHKITITYMRIIFESQNTYLVRPCKSRCHCCIFVLNVIYCLFYPEVIP